MITKIFSSLWNKLKSCISRTDTSADEGDEWLGNNFLRIVEEIEFWITENDDFLLRVVEEIVSSCSVSSEEVAQHMDPDEVAQEMDSYEIAALIGGDISPTDIAENLDTIAIAEEFDITDIASCIEFEIDYDEVRAGLDLDALQFANVDEDSIINKVIEEVVSRLEAN